MTFEKQLFRGLILVYFKPNCISRNVNECKYGLLFSFFPYPNPKRWYRFSNGLLILKNAKRRTEINFFKCFYNYIFYTKRALWTIRSIILCIRLFWVLVGSADARFTKREGKNKWNTGFVIAFIERVNVNIFPNVLLCLKRKNSKLKNIS